MANRKNLMYIVFFLYLGALFYVTLLAWNYGASLGSAAPGGRNYNLIPFRSIYRIAVFSPDIMDPIRILIGNIVMFVPFGFFLYALFSKLRSIGLVALLGFCTSSMIEVSQFLFTHRVANIDDLILNTAGALIGAVIAWTIIKARKRIIVYSSSQKSSL
ncbi:VanZ family protein [Alkalihalophilus pseudofirmus]|uniref:VanZ family protein n=1 Tax=Alkalihalophilus pseudofirmus TaxID=79885 RepID=UPI000951B398|nr:VanZ family protein [Alkalihalophilus pseudofirmus]